LVNNCKYEDFVTLVAEATDQSKVFWIPTDRGWHELQWRNFCQAEKKKKDPKFRL